MSLITPFLDAPDSVTAHDIERLIAYMRTLPPNQRAIVSHQIKQLIERQHIHRARSDYYYYAQSVMPNFIHGNHIKLLAQKLDAVVRGEIKRLVVAMPPRHSKSQNVSKLFPAYYLGHHPDAQLMMVSHTSPLATDFGRAVRDIIISPEYHRIFGNDVSIRADAKAAGEWGTDQGGKLYAAGVGGNIAGRGASLLVIDDAVAEQEALHGITRPEVFEKVYEWYLLARQRLMPGGAIVLCATRWSLNDLTGLVLDRSQEEWEVLTLPAVWPDERILWPEFWTPEEIFKMRDEMLSNNPQRWHATYQQEPQAAGGTLIEREWLQDWDYFDPPRDTHEVIITIDPAFTDNTKNDPSGISVCGLFTRTLRTQEDIAEAIDEGILADSDPDVDSGDPIKIRNMIVLDSFEAWHNFPDLKQLVYELNTRWRPSTILIENKASGISLVQELASIGLPVALYNVSRGRAGSSNDKIERLSSVLPLIRAGRMHIPTRVQGEWADKLRQQLCCFPQVTHDDLVDTITMALTYYRRLGGLTAPLDNASSLMQNAGVLNPASTIDPSEDEVTERGVFRGYTNTLRG